MKKIEAELNRLTPLKDDISDLNKKLETSKKEISKLTSQIDELNKLIIQKDEKIKELNENVLEKENLFKEQSDRLNSLESELAALKPVEIATQKSEERERLICPKCGAFGKDIKTEENKSKILSYAGHIPIYAKNNVCKKCGKII